MKTILKYLGGNKIGWCLIMFVAAVVLLAFERLDSDQWVVMVQFLTIVAVGGNVAAQAIHAFGKRKSE